MRQVLRLSLITSVIGLSILLRPAEGEETGKSTTKPDIGVASAAGKSAAEKATLVDRLLQVLEDDRPTITIKPPATTEQTKPSAAAKKKKVAKPGKAQKPEAQTASDSKAAKPEATKKATVVRFTLSGAYTEEPDSAGIMGMLTSLSEDGGTIFEMIERLDAAANDKEVAAVWLKFDEFAPARGNIHEFRAVIQRLRKAGKPVYAELHSGAEVAAYQVAVACDKIYMPEGTNLEILGPRMAVEHYKGLLDKLGMQFDVLRVGNCKGAYEPFTHEKMSADVRANYEALVDDIYNALVETIAADRHLEAGPVKQLIDRGVFSAEAARKAGLVDYVVHASRMEDELQKALSAKSGLKLISNYKRKEKEEITGVMDLMKLMMGGGKARAANGKSKIAVVYETGEITTGKSGNGLFGEKTQGSSTISKLLRKVADDPNVKAVVLRIDGPGGSATASDLIWQETMRTKEKKPVVCSMGSVAASGTYFTAVAAQRIYAEPDTLTGSIGVLGGKLVTQVLFQKLGVHTEFVGRGAMSGVELDRPFTVEERKVLMDLVQTSYKDFVGKVAQCRKLPADKVASLAEGRVYTARQAEKLGLIDELGTLNDAIAAAKKFAGLKPDEPVEIVRYPEERSLFEILGGDREDEASLRVAAQAAGIPATLLKRLRLPSFFFRPETTGLPHLYYWAPMPRIE